MNPLNRIRLVIILVVFAEVSAYADLELIDPIVLEQQLTLAEDFYGKRDVDALITLIKEAHLFVKQDVALKLGRIGADKALPILRKYDQIYSDFACAESGQFGVAILLIENKMPDAQKKALLAIAAKPRGKGTPPFSVIDAAGRELSRFDGDDIIDTLKDVNTYGSQYTTLALQCRRLSEPDAIAKCIAVLESHETPQKAQAAEEILINFGKKGKSQVEKLLLRVENKIKPTDPTFTIPKTVVGRCQRVLEQIEVQEKANNELNIDAVMD